MRSGNEETRAEESTPAGARAAESRNTAGREAAGPPAPSSEPTEGVLTLVCEVCGRDYFFEDEPPPEDFTCGKCGNQVFRSFFTAVDDEVARDFEDTTGRDLNPDDPEGDVQPGDVMDLNRL